MSETARDEQHRERMRRSDSSSGSCSAEPRSYTFADGGVYTGHKPDCNFEAGPYLPPDDRVASAAEAQPRNSGAGEISDGATRLYLTALRSVCADGHGGWIQVEMTSAPARLDGPFRHRTAFAQPIRSSCGCHRQNGFGKTTMAQSSPTTNPDPLWLDFTIEHVRLIESNMTSGTYR